MSRFVEDGLPSCIRCCDLLELTLDFEARDLSSVIKQAVRSEFKETEDEGNSVYRRLRVKIDRASRLVFQRRTAYGIVQRTEPERFQTPGDG